jgi:hypothetical protein
VIGLRLFYQGIKVGDYFKTPAIFDCSSYAN